MLKRTTLSFLSIILFILNGFGCDCIMTPLELHIEETETIVVVEIIKILDSKEEREKNFVIKDWLISRKINSGYRAIAKISKSYKGELLSGATIELTTNFTNCDQFYSIGEKYILFLENKSMDYLAKSCSYSSDIGSKWGKKIKRRTNRIIRKKNN